MNRIRWTHLLAANAMALLTASTQAFADSAAPSSLDEISVVDLQARMTRGETSAHAIARTYLDRIAAFDASGPTLHAVIELNPDAIAIADALDLERTKGHVRGLLHGIPVLIKDNIDSADRMHTTAGSLALADSIAARDSTVVARLRAAGAVILGKTNLSEWANFRSSQSTSGWSARGGQTKNPYALDRNPCGSSSGSGVAVSANLVAIAVGTETDGSIVCPSATNGIVGIKPTVGLVSRAGIVPISHSQDTAGPMARSVADAAALLDVLAGSDPRDAATAKADGHRDTYTRYLDPDGLHGARIGVVRQFAGFNRDTDALFDANLVALRAAGATLVDPVEIEHVDKLGDAETIVLQTEFKADVDAYLAQTRSDVGVRDLAALIAFNQREASREMPWFGQETLEQSQARGPLTDTLYRKALRTSKRLAGRDGIDATLARHHLDALVAPTNGPASTIDWINGDHILGGSATPAAVAGYPHITVPAGFVHGLPIGLSFFAGAWSEPSLIRFAYAFEQATHARAPPRFAEHATPP